MTTPAPWHERWNFDVQEFSAAGLRTFAVVEGRADAFPVLFLHGTPGGAFIWAPVIAALGRSRRAIAPDWPGWGKSASRFSDREQQFEATPRSALEWLNGILEAQKVDRFDLVAQGSAAWAALELLHAAPDRIRRLSLVSVRLWKSEGHRLLSVPRWTRRRIESWLEQRSTLSPRTRDEWRIHFVSVLESVESGRTARGLSEKDFEPRFADYRAALAAYHGAMLMLWGERDPRSPYARIEELISTLDDPAAHRVEDAGAFPMLDRPEEVAAMYKEFLSD